MHNRPGKQRSTAHPQPMACGLCPTLRSPPPITMATLSQRTDRSGLPRGPQLRRHLLPELWLWSSRVSTARRKAMPIPVCMRWQARQTIRFTPRYQEITACLAPSDSQRRAHRITWPPASVRLTPHYSSRAGVPPHRTFLCLAQSAARGSVFCLRGACQRPVCRLDCLVRCRVPHCTETEWLT